MSRGKTEMVLAFIEAINRRDWEGVFDDAAPGFEVDVSRAVGPYRGVYTVEDAQQLFRDFADSWQSLRIEPDEYVEGDDFVLGTSTMHLEGRDGISVTSTVTWVWSVGEGKLARATMYQDRSEALAAVGLDT